MHKVNVVLGSALTNAKGEIRDTFSATVKDRSQHCASLFVDQNIIIGNWTARVLSTLLIRERTVIEDGNITGVPYSTILGDAVSIFE
jgi:hypothetical protein